MRTQTTIDSSSIARRAGRSGLAALAVALTVLLVGSTPAVAADTAGPQRLEERIEDVTSAGQGNQGNQGNQGRQMDVAIGDVRVAVTDLGTGRQVADLHFGDTLILERGQRVRLRLVADPANRNRALRYPPASFELLSGARRIDVIHVDRAEGSAVIEGVREDDPARPDSTTLVQIDLLDTTQVPRKLQGGTITIRVEDDLTGDGALPSTSTIRWDDADENGVADQAEEIVQTFYRGILLREPEAESVAPWADEIEGRGFDGVVSVARSIATSRESREIYDREITVSANGRRFTRDVTSTDRVMSLYRELLGLEPSQVDREQLEADIERIEDGDLVDLVTEMVRSDLFLEELGISDLALDDRFVQRRWQK